jgi:hypothetical protein
MTRTHPLRLAGLILMILLAASPPEAQALSLGRLQGSAQIGRPLALTVQIQTDPGEDLSALCLEAEVYHAETRQDPRGVRVQADAAQPAMVRISSANGVDEPVVTLLLRAGCAQKTTRRYVLLADPPTDTVAPPALAASSAAPAVSTAPSAPDASSSAAVPVQTATTTVPHTKALKPPHRKSKRKVTKPRLTLAAPATPVTGGSASLAATAAPPLGSASATETPTPAAQALAQEKISLLERDIKAAQAAALRHEAALAGLQARLTKAEAERFPMEVVYALVGLVLACLTAVGWLWSRLRRVQADSGEWWSNSVMTPSAAFANSNLAAPVPAASPPPNLPGDAPPAAAVQPPDLNALIDFDLNQPKAPREPGETASKP